MLCDLGLYRLLKLLLCALSSCRLMGAKGKEVGEGQWEDKHGGREEEVGKMTWNWVVWCVGVSRPWRWGSRMKREWQLW